MEESQYQVTDRCQRDIYFYSVKVIKIENIIEYEQQPNSYSWNGIIL